MIIELPARLQVLYAAFPKKDHEILIADLCAVMDLRDRNWLSPYITRLNRRLVKHKLAIKPGVVKKNTYRLTAI